MDLYYRLNVFPIELPPLRERADDIPLLVDHFLRTSKCRQAESIERVSDDVMAALVRYDWPGNIRELQKVRANAVGATAAPLADYVKEYDDVYFELDRIQS